MKKSFYQLIVVVFIVYITLVGCSNNEVEKADESKTTTEQPEQSEAVEQSGEAITFPLEEPITISIFGRAHPNNQKPVAELQVFQEMQKDTNVIVKWDSVLPNQVTERKNLLFASNELPDAFYGHTLLSNSEIIRYASQGMLIPLEDLIEKHAPNIKQLFVDRPEMKKKLTAPDGHIYSLPLLHESKTYLSRPALFINKKWLDQLGLKLPSTTEEFYEALVAFRDNDMNGNGRKDALPLSFGTTETDGHYALSGSFGIIDKMEDHLWIDNGKVGFAPATEGYKEYVKYMHRLYSEKLLDPEVFTHDTSVYHSKLKSEEPIVGAFVAWMQSTVFGTADTDFVALPPLKGPDGHQIWPRGSHDESLGAFAISSVNQHPEVTMAWVDLIYEEQRSIEHTFGPLDVNMKKNAQGNYEYIPTPEGLAYGKFRHLETVGASGLHLLTLERNEKIIQGPQLEKLDLVELYIPFLQEEIYPNVLMSDEDGKTLLRIQSELTTKDGYIDSKFAGWVINGNVDSEWDNHLDQLKRMGLDEMLDIYQHYYDALSK